MNKGDGGDSFGFAPHGRLGQHVDRRFVHPKVNEEPQKTERIAPSSPSPQWAWLLVGVLLGSGSTLVASSLWLQGSYVNPSIAMDAEPTVDQVAEDHKTAQETKVAKKEPKNVPAVDDRNVATLTRDHGSDDTVATTDRSAVSGSDAPRPSSETSFDSRRERLESISDGETLLVSDGLVSDGRPQRADPTEAGAGETDGEVAATFDVGHKDHEESAHEEPVVVAAVEPREYSATRSARTSGLHYPQNVDRKQATATVSANASGDSSNDLVAHAAHQNRDVQSSGNVVSPDERAVTPIRSSAENTNSGSKQRGAANVDNPGPTVGEPALFAESNTNGRRSKRIYRVQLAAVDDERAAQVYWREAKTRLPAVLDGVEPVFDRREVDERIFFRVWVGAFDERADADNYCGWLKSKGQDCFVTRG